MEKLPAENEIHIYQTSLNSFHHKSDNLSQILSEDELLKANRYKFEKDKKNFIAGRAVLRIISAKYLRTEPSLLNFFYEEKGKPFLKNTSLKFNLSHSGNYAVYAFTLNNEVGIDIEHLKEMPDALEIAKRFFSEAEISALKNSVKVKESFFNCWTRKEAFIKAIGEGLSYPLKDFAVTLEPGVIPEFIHVRNDESIKNEWSLYNINVPPEYISSLAIRARGMKIIYKVLS